MGVGVGVGGGRVEGLHQGNGEVVCIGREMQEEPASLVKIKEGGKKNKIIAVSKNSKTRPIKEMDYLQNGAQQQHLSHAFCF